jgi:Na+/H+ antiporter NhaD/arsenite permease-like protein
MSIGPLSHAPPEASRQPAKRSAFEYGALVVAGLVVATLIARHLLGENHAAHGHPENTPSLWAVLPFAGMLLSIALLPLLPATQHWWHRNRNKLMVSLAFAAVTIAYYLFGSGGRRVVDLLEHALVVEYTPFIILLFSLYVISGDLPAHPATNTAFLAAGAALASFVGTTGASMLLIRPLLQTNRERRHVTHTVVFFIFLVSNVGGCLLPTGDPPLFLGYLMGVPFLWTLSLWKAWAFVSVALLIVYYAWDRRIYRSEAPRDILRDETQVERLWLHGKVNLVLLVGVVLCVALVKPHAEFPGLGFKAFPFLREMLMLVLVAASLLFTSKQVREWNKFDYGAILEVAALFIGIFICMQAPIEILHANGHSLRPYLSSSHAFFWATGGLSSFLDNAPTYVVFFETAETMTPMDAPASEALRLLDGGTIRHTWLTAISLGAVFMGAMTYIGNGPNFMVKSIAEQSGVKMPSFFGYMIYSVLILLPLFLVMTLLFL